MDRSKVDTTTGIGAGLALKEGDQVVRVPMETCMVEVQILRKTEALLVRLLLQVQGSPESKLKLLNTELATELMVMPQ